MNLVRLGSNVVKISANSNLIKRKHVITTVLRYSRYNAHETNNSIHAKSEEVDELEKPYPYTISQAASWQAKYSRMPNDKDKPWYQGYVISLSMGIFFIYFFILREESDVDKIFDRQLINYFSDMSENEFKTAMKVNQNFQK